MKYPCGLIKDLLPLYHDQVCSPESRAAVEEHLAGCPGCTESYRELAQSDLLAPAVPEPDASRLLLSLSGVKRRLRRRVLMALGLALAVTSVLVAAGLWLGASTLVMPEDLLDTSGICEEDENIRIGYTPGYEAYAYSRDNRIATGDIAVDLDGDGKAEIISFCTYSITPWQAICQNLGLGLVEPSPIDTPPHVFFNRNTTASSSGAPVEGPVDFIYFLPDCRDVPVLFQHEEPDAQREVLNTRAVLLWTGGE